MSSHEKQSISDSKLSDLIRDELENNDSFVKEVDTKIILGEIINVKTDYFTDDLFNIINNKNKTTVCGAIKRAIEGIFASKFGYTKLNTIKKTGIRIQLNDEMIENLIVENEWEKYQKELPDDQIAVAISWATEKYFIETQHMISKIDIAEEITNWFKKIGKAVGSRELPKTTLMLLIDGVYSKPDIHQNILKIAFEMGVHSDKILFDKSQTEEVGEYIKGKYHMKRFNDLIGEVMFFNGYFYEGNARELILQESLNLMFESRDSQRREVVYYIMASTPIIDLDIIDDHVNMVCCKNGLYNVKTGEFKEGFDPEIITFDQLPNSYNENAERGKIKEIVEFILPKERSRINFYDWLSGAFLTYTGLTFMKIFESKAGMGKTTLDDYARGIVGRKNVAEPKFHVLVKDPTTRIDVHRKRIIIDSDMSEKTPTELQTLKKWILQEDETDRSIYGRNVNYKPFCILMGITNRLFEIPDENDLEAMADRCDIDRLTVRIRDRDDDFVKDEKKIMVKAFKEKSREGDAELTFLLKNATQILKEGKVKSKQSREAVMDLWNRLGNLVKQFCKIRIKKVADAWISNEGMWTAWQEYCLRRNIDIGRKMDFLEKFRKINNLDMPVQKRIVGIDRREWGYFGIRLMTKEEIEKIEQTKLNGIDET